MICIAHRGASGHEPENTLRAIKKALSMGAKWFELDVYPVENELVVIHDEKLDRTTNGKGYVMEHSLRYIQSLDAGKGEPVPLLREVFDLINEDNCVNIELKAKGTATLVSNLINEYVSNKNKNFKNFIVSSFIHDELRILRTIDDKILLGILSDRPYSGILSLAKELAAYSINLKYTKVTKDFITDAHKEGLKVFTYTVNDKLSIEKMDNLGVDGVFTNFPELFYKK
ncbi:MAG: glycerophosphodiester phosphodiesterase [Desulfobacterales bacterium]|nr:glycerophosphodiester phosphodiesterase [Desulfobacterales bacterium]